MHGPPDGIIQNALLTHSGLCGHGPGGTYVVADWAEAAETVIVATAIAIIDLRANVMSFSIGFEGQASSCLAACQRIDRKMPFAEVNHGEGYAIPSPALRQPETSLATKSS